MYVFIWANCCRACTGRLKEHGECAIQHMQHCVEDWNWPQSWMQSLVITLPKTGNLKQCNNYRFISLINHPSKVLLRTILNRLKHDAEKIIDKEQAGFREKRSTKNLRSI